MCVVITFKIIIFFSPKSLNWIMSIKVWWWRKIISFFSLIEYFLQKCYLAETGVFDLKNFWLLILNTFFCDSFVSQRKLPKPRTKTSLVKLTGKQVLFPLSKIYISYLFRIIFLLINNWFKWKEVQPYISNEH